MLVVNIMSDVMKGRRLWQRATCFLSFVQKVPLNTPAVNVNVFGGWTRLPGAHHQVWGDHKEKDNLINLLRYTCDNYRDNDIMVIVEADTVPCIDFARYVVEKELDVPHRESVRVGYTSLDGLVKPYIKAIRKRRHLWATVPVDMWWGTPCYWMPVNLWKQYLRFLLSDYKPSTQRFLLDGAVKDWLKSREVDVVCILLPNPVLHIGTASAVFKEWKGERKTNYCYLEDPYALNVPSGSIHTGFVRQ